MYRPEDLREGTALAPALNFVEGKTIDMTFVLKKHNWCNKSSSFLLGHSFSATVASACGTRLCACYIVSVSASNGNNCEENSL